MKLVASFFLLLPSLAVAFSPSLSSGSSTAATRTALRLAAPVDSDFSKAIPAVGADPADGAVDPNVYNVPLEQAAELFLVSVSQENNMDRKAGIPFLETKDKDYFVDDVSLKVSRQGGLGLELLELAGGRDDGYGLTIIENVSGNAKAAGVIPGDSIASVQISTLSTDNEDAEQILECECRDFDSTIGLLQQLPPDLDSIILNVKRIRRWPKIRCVVEYPPVQVAEGADNKETLELFAGENLRRALLNRGIVMEDPRAPKCDFCGMKCSVKIDMGMPLLSPMSVTEEKLMARNPKCRVSCKTVVGYNMQEGEMRLKVNLSLWTDKDKRDSSPFASR